MSSFNKKRKYEDVGNNIHIPSRWLQCPRKGQVVNNKFLPFKTPLDSKYDGQVPEENQFKIAMLFTVAKTLRKKIGLIVNLCNTERFYNMNEVIFKEQDCGITQLKCKGRSETPTEEQTTAFVNLCDNFIRNRPLDIIGVHCTHGFNRTGFLICAYLVEKESWGVEAAVRKFAEARPPGIYKQDYLNELFERYGDKEDTPMAPALPAWCTESDDADVEDDDKQSGSHSGQANGGGWGKRKKEFMKKVGLVCTIQFLE
uniref:Uncharacterized protein n=1 Tax=Arion vulgaris TaxID=1028688 RepID=A0A0B7ADD3_9EUPU